MKLLEPGDKAPDFETTDQDRRPLSLKDFAGKKVDGLKFTGVHRVTYLIDEKGKVAAVWPKVKPAEHAREILDFVDGGHPAIG